MHFGPTNAAILLAPMALFLQLQRESCIQRSKKEIDSFPTKTEANFRQLLSAEK